MVNYIDDVQSVSTDTRYDSVGSPAILMALYLIVILIFNFATEVNATEVSLKENKISEKKISPLRNKDVKGSEKEAKVNFREMVAKAVIAYPSVRGYTAQAYDYQSQAANYGSQIWPKVTGGFSGSGLNTNHISNLNQDYEIPSTNVYHTNITAQVSQLLYDAGATFRRIDSANSKTRQIEAQREITASNIALQAVQAWFNVYRQRKQIELNKDYVAALDDLLKRISETVTSGASNRTDQLKAESRLADARTRLSTAELELLKAESDFADLFNFSPPALFLPDRSNAVANSSIDLILEANPKLDYANNSVNSAEFDLAATKAESIPALRANFGGVRYNIFSQQNLYDLSGGISISYDIFDGGKNKAQIESATQKLSNAQMDRDLLLKIFKKSLENSIAERQAKIKQVEYFRQSVKISKEVVDSELEQFSIARKGFVEILDSNRELLGARTDLLNGECDLDLTNYSIMALSGEILSFFEIKFDPIPKYSVFDISLPKN